MASREDGGSHAFSPSYFHNPGSEPLCPLTIGQLIDIAVEKWADAEAIVSVHQNQRLTFKEAREKADRIAAGLVQLGLNPGDRLGIWGPNSSEWYLCRLAAARGGFVAVQIEPAYQLPQLLYSLSKTGTKAMIFAEGFKLNKYHDIVCSLVPELEDCPESGVELSCSQLPALKTLITMSDQTYRGIYRLEEVMMSARPDTLNRIHELQKLIQPDDGCNIQFSSGTTGFPKAVYMSHHAFVNNALAIGKRMCLESDNNKMVQLVQFCHISGTLGGILCNLLFGATTILPAPMFDAKICLDVIEQERATFCFGTPSLYVDMIDAARKHKMSVSTVKVAGFGGAPCTPRLAEEMKRVLNVERLFPIYGLTETTTNFVGHPRDTLEQMIYTVGSVIDHLEVKVVDRNGAMVPIGTPGELWVRGPSLLLKYWEDSDKTLQFKTEEGWAKTGDLFVLQQDGYGKIVGRLKECIIRIGDKIFPAEMETFFQDHPDILEAQVFGIPDEKVGEEICVYIRAREGVQLEESDITSYCKDKIPDYRIPRYIRFIKEFPRSAMGKVQKTVLLEALKEELHLLSPK